MITLSQFSIGLGNCQVSDLVARVNPNAYRFSIEEDP